MNKIHVMLSLFFSSMFLQGCVVPVRPENAQNQRITGYNSLTEALDEKPEKIVRDESKPVVVVQDNLSKIKVYPIPWQPNSSGRFGSVSKGCGTGLMIDNVTSTEIRIRIFSITGDLIMEREVTTLSNCITWDGKNISGRDVASGTYVMIINDEIGRKVVKKIAIER